MLQTIAAVYDDAVTARHALEDLVDAGFSRDAIELATNSVASHPPGDGMPHDPDAPIANFREMLERLFSSDRNRAESYMQAVERGNCVLTVTAGQDELERAAPILDRYAPINLGTDDWSQAPWAGQAGEPRIGETGASVGRETPQAETPPAQPRYTPPYDYNARPHLSDHLEIGSGLGWETSYFEEGNSSRMGAITETQGMPMNETYQTRLMWPRPGMHGKAAPRPGQDADDETYYRVHWNENYGSDDSNYDDYAHAYQYGKMMSRDEQYQGRDWDEVEPELRNRWERDYPSAWERMKLAIRHGWHRITS